MLEFDIAHLRQHQALPEGLRFRFEFAGVRSVRAITFAAWPGEWPDMAGGTRDEQTRLLREYAAKGREESMAWADFEAAFAAADLLVWDADLVTGEDEAAVRLEGLADDERWCAAFLRAERLSVSRSDGVSFSLDQMIRLGEEYWDAFGRKPPR